MLDLGKNTAYRNFVGWAVLLETLFSKLNLKPNEDYLLKKMPDIFVKIGHGMTDMITGCTEFKFQHAANLDLNSLRFSNYKNSFTGLSLNWNLTSCIYVISPALGGCHPNFRQLTR